MFGMYQYQPIRCFPTIHSALSFSAGVPLYLVKVDPSRPWGDSEKQGNVAKSPRIRAHTRRTVLSGVNLHRRSIKTQSRTGIVCHGAPNAFIPMNLSVTWKASEPPNARCLLNLEEANRPRDLQVHPAQLCL